ncbi:hypothetical protein E2562_005249 [Oryza meyeriana var. granulata]|uniref:Uncharacterized protein n=1 Tax=Oryza meyeriana var. granulata TaxID=110450 RepID=A0A6G1EEU1_9ORYZ|nr:hypothetical protein E2562_005249 [Oryza meyeriana var. granulata]
MGFLDATGEDRGECPAGVAVPSWRRWRRGCGGDRTNVEGGKGWRRRGETRRQRENQHRSLRGESGGY